MNDVDYFVSFIINRKLEDLETHFEADVLSYYGPIGTWAVKPFRIAIEKVAIDKNKKHRLVVVLNTGGGEVEAVERMVEIIRRWYDEVYFVVPQIAMSAGTIFCMSGDRILMDYTSALGPIDPQVQGKDGNYVPALGYLDKFNEIVQKSLDGKLSAAEFAIAQNQDLGILRRYEQARDLSVDLLKKWLVDYKFRSWTKHRTDPDKRGNDVTQEEKEARAQKIALQLGDNRLWHSHGRMIGVNTLTQVLRLEIDDYTDNQEQRNLISNYHDVIVDFMQKNSRPFLLHVRNNLGG
ncbi:MAG: hypothetical protein WBF84_16925 [Castellaniella sp.]|uniref:SDH family Clp fold serine proteinase n=1 Tax=Castellaniella sp. TaxID=1955812 RepID=UPI003C763C98